MKVDSITLYHTRMELRNPFRTSFGVTQEREIMITRVQAEGLDGYGECIAEKGPWYSGETIDSCQSIINNFISPWLKKTDLDHPTDFKKLVQQIKGNQMAKACMEDAIWDLYGQIENKSLQKLIEGT
ncbi:MAG: o-succinylbenzoate synthase, partial [Candidatus Heimdallarchaeota archaeon]|nr:o-succinylbenzoate synthase [Candidatus Heimdallarchaeota archaeon]MCK4254210.1 o-succinylbenzoate synthase [Candidatus Heimdallarchaeota archaeon]